MYICNDLLTLPNFSSLSTGLILYLTPNILLNELDAFSSHTLNFTSPSLIGQGWLRGM